MLAKTSIYIVNISEVIDINSIITTLTLPWLTLQPRVNNMGGTILLTLASTQNPFLKTQTLKTHCPVNWILCTLFKQIPTGQELLKLSKSYKHPSFTHH